MMEQRRQSSQLQSRLSSRRASGPSEKVWASAHKPGLRQLNVPRLAVARSPGNSPKFDSPNRNLKSARGFVVSGPTPSKNHGKIPPRQSPRSHDQPSTPTTASTKQDTPKEPSRFAKMSKFPKDPAVSNPFTSEKPYQTKKRTIVCNMVRNIIYGDLATRAASLAHGKKVLSKVATHLVLTPGKNSRQSSPKDQEPPKSAASTPKHSRLFLPRKQSHESLTPVDTSSRNSASGEPPPSAKDSSSNPRRDNGKLTIKNITVRRAPSLGVDSRKISEKLGSLLGARKASKNQQQQRADAEGKKRSPVVTINGEKIGKVTVVGIVGGIGTTESSTATGSFVRFNDAVGQEREKLIQYNRMYFSQNGEFPETTLEYYKMVKLIGKGAFGKVALAIHKLTGKYVAIKTIEKDHLKDEFSRRKVLREIYIMKKIKHVNVIRLLEVFESAKQVLMVMEYAGGGDLLHYVRQKKYLTEAEARPIFRQVVYGLAHIHSRNVLHRDIKLDNILLDGEGGVKICDFGVSKIIDKHKSINDQCGTPAYIAPEIISNLVFQLYVIMPILGVQGLLRGSLEPGSAAICDAVRHGALQGAQHERTACADTGGHLWLPGAAVRSYVHDANVSIDARSLIDGLLKLNPRERLSIPEILAHPWLEQELDEDSDEYNYYIVRNEKVADEPSNAPPTINTLNIENLFFQNRPHVRLLFKDYCYIANDFYTHHIDEEAAKTVETFGYPKDAVMGSLTRGEINHATASYNLLELG